MAGVGFALLAVVILGYVFIGGFEYRAYVIHIGALLGTTDGGERLDADLAGAAEDHHRDPRRPGARRRAGRPGRHAIAHNTYMSVALIWTMITQHTTAFALGGWIWLLIAIAIGWLATTQLYAKATAVKGF